MSSVSPTFLQQIMLPWFSRIHKMSGFLSFVQRVCPAWLSVEDSAVTWLHCFPFAPFPCLKALGLKGHEYPSFSRRQISFHGRPFTSCAEATQPWDQPPHESAGWRINPFWIVLPRLAALGHPTHMTISLLTQGLTIGFHPIPTLCYCCLTYHPEMEGLFYGLPAVAWLHQCSSGTQAVAGGLGHILPMVEVGSSQFLVRARLRYRFTFHWPKPVTWSSSTSLGEFYTFQGFVSI